MLVEILLCQRSGEALRIGTLESLAVGDTVRIDGRADWIIVRCVFPRRLGVPPTVVCERRSQQRRVAA